MNDVIDVYTHQNVRNIICAKQVKKALRGVKVEVTHRGNVRRKYRISGLTSQPTRELMYVSEYLALQIIIFFLYLDFLRK